MIYLLSLIISFLPLHLTNSTSTTDAEKPEEKIQWMTFEEAVKANQKEQKKILIDIYTDWCGWCKVMDRKTFTDPTIIKYVNDHFYAVKLDAEQRESISFNDTEFVWRQGGRNGTHELAYSLLDGNMSFPAFVFLTEDFKRISIIKGFKDAGKFMKDLSYVAEDKFKKSGS